MDFNEALKAQPKVVAHLERSMAQSKLSHAYIFEGTKDSYVEEIAVYFAVLLLCNNDPNCEQKQRVIHRTHPNVKFIESSSSVIVKEDIIELQHDFNQTALEAGPKIYIINDAHKMNSYAANALLKFLEEPHPDIYGILVTDDALNLLPTITSRSQLIHFPNIAKKTIEKHLLEEGVEPLKAKIAAHLFQRLDRALHFLEDPDTDRIIEGVKGLYQHLSKGKSSLVYMHQEFPDLSRDKAGLELFLELMMLYQKDLIYAKMGVQEALTFEEEATTIEDLQSPLSKSQIITVWEKILNLIEKMNQPIHHGLALEDVLISLERGSDEA
jgi:DNA polymerase-3 subunit delta'